METPILYSHPAFADPAARPRSLAQETWRVSSLGELLFLPLKEIARIPIGFGNLLCATLLPDTPDLDVRACLDTLASWTRHVRHETDRHLHHFRRAPGDFQHSEGYFRVLTMVTVLQQDFGVRYAPECIENPLFLESGQAFIHGLLAGKRAGTCANMPVLYAAIGRSLGYPIYLCCAKGHIFCRWVTKDGRERFNIEGSGVGLGTPDDDHYKGWPFSISDREVYLGHYLRNLDPFEEIALFMATRGHCLLDRGHILDAIIAFAHAHRLAPTDPHQFAFMLGVINREIRERQAGSLPGSYREAEVFTRENCPRLQQYVLSDNFPRVQKQPRGGIAPGRCITRD